MGKGKGKRQFGRPEKRPEYVIDVDFDELVDLQAREFGFLFPAVLSAFFFSSLSRPALESLAASCLKSTGIFSRG